MTGAPTTRARRHRVTAALTVGFGAALALAGSTLASTTAREAARAPMKLPLESAATTPSTAWAVVEMGTTQGSHNLFWQLFNYRMGTKRWVLVTPPGTADNGGLVSSAIGSEDLVGFGTNQLLRFSPLASTNDSGTSWSPGGLDEGLVPQPGTLAAGVGNSAAALVTSRGTDLVLRRSGSLTSWTAIASTKSVADLAPTCRVGSLDTVDVPSPTVVLVGASCVDAGVVALARFSGSSASLVKVATSSAWSHEITQVLRLVNGEGSGGTIAEGLIAGENGQASDVAAIWAGRSGAPWSASPALPIPSGSTLVASGTGPGSSQFVVVRSRGTLVAEETIGPGEGWQASGELPPGSETIAVEPGGGVDALSVHGSTLTVWHAPHLGATFSETQTIAVPIQYGSSG